MQAKKWTVEIDSRDTRTVQRRSAEVPTIIIYVYVVRVLTFAGVKGMLVRGPLPGL